MDRMIVTRVDSAKDLRELVERITVAVDGNEYTLTLDHRGILIHKREGSITIRPGCANEIYVK